VPKGHSLHLILKGAVLVSTWQSWAALCRNGMIFGPFFFKGNVNGVAYLLTFY
jgi:hypothetical protein